METLLRNGGVHDRARDGAFDRFASALAGFYTVELRMLCGRSNWGQREPTPFATICIGTALAAGVVINPGPEWSVNKERARSWMRLCFASISHEEIHQGGAALADVCRKEFGVPR